MNKEKPYTYIICLSLLLISFSGIFLLSEKNITGAAVLSINQENISREDALNALLEAEDDVKEMEALNLSAYFFMDTLLSAKRSFIGDRIVYLQAEISSEIGFKREYLESLLEVAKETPSYEVKKLDYSEAARLAGVIAARKQQAYRILDMISMISEKAGAAEALDLIEEAKASFSAERYDEAEAYLQEADLALEKAGTEYERVKGLIALSRGFFEKYWLHILVAVIIIAAIAVPTVKYARKKLAKRKLESLRIELESINNSIKKAQEACFKDRKITEATYRVRIAKYRSRMAEIKYTIPVLESIVSGEKGKIKKEPENKGVLEVKK